MTLSKLELERITDKKLTYRARTYMLIAMSVSVVALEIALLLLFTLSL